MGLSDAQRILQDLRHSYRHVIEAHRLLVKEHGGLFNEGEDEKLNREHKLRIKLLFQWVDKFDKAYEEYCRQDWGSILGSPCPELGIAAGAISRTADAIRREVAELGFLETDYKENKLDVLIDHSDLLRGFQQVSVAKQPTTNSEKRPQISPDRTGETIRNPTVSLDARALAVFFENVELTKIEIAKKLGCHEKSLAPKRCPRLSAAIASYKTPVDGTRRAVRGVKTKGRLDAWEES
jgi:hypothetical protein